MAGPGQTDRFHPGDVGNPYTHGRLGGIRRGFPHPTRGVEVRGGIFDPIRYFPGRFDIRGSHIWDHYLSSYLPFSIYEYELMLSRYPVSLCQIYPFLCASPTLFPRPLPPPYPQFPGYSQMGCDSSGKDVLGFDCRTGLDDDGFDRHGIHRGGMLQLPRKMGENMFPPGGPPPAMVPPMMTVPVMGSPTSMMPVPMPIGMMPPPVMAPPMATLYMGMAPGAMTPMIQGAYPAVSGVYGEDNTDAFAYGPGYDQINRSGEWEFGPAYGRSNIMITYF